MKTRMLIGCYTDPENKNGLNLLEFDSVDSAFTLIAAHEVENSSFVIKSPKADILYTVNENHTVADGVTAVAFDRAKATFENISEINIQGADPCYISVDANARHLFSANYTDGTLSAVALAADGTLSKTVQVIKHPADEDSIYHGKSHMHAAVFSPDQKFLLVANLGLDTITVYEYHGDNENQPLNEQAQQVYQFPDGTGPRHLLFDGGGKFVYVVGELDGSVHVLKWDGTTLSFVQKTALMPGDFNGKNSAAEIRLHPNGNFLYVSNRGDANQIISFSVAVETGQLSLLENTPTNGIGPRNFAIDPSGNFMVIAHQQTNDIRIFNIDSAGKPVDSGISNKINSPVFVFFV